MIIWRTIKTKHNIIYQIAPLAKCIMLLFLSYYLWFLDLEMEVRKGALKAADPHSSCLVFIRNIVDIKNYITHPSVSDYLVISHSELEDKV